MPVLIESCKALKRTPEDAVDGLDFGDQVGDDDGVGEDVESINPQAHHEAFLDVLSAVPDVAKSKDMAAPSALRRLDEEARAVDPSQDDSNAAPAWSPFLYHVTGPPRLAFPRHGTAQPRGDRRGIEGPEERGQQRHGEDPGQANESVFLRMPASHTGSPRLPVHGRERSPEGVGPGGQMRLELGRYATYVDVALGLTRHWTLNKLQSMAVLLPAAQVGGLTLAAVDSRLKQYRDDHHRPFGGIPMVMFFGDFFQFDPVLQTSLLLPTPRDPGGQRPDSSAKHLAAHKLFLQFANVVILPRTGPRGRLCKAAELPPAPAQWGADRAGLPAAEPTRLYTVVRVLLRRRPESHHASEPRPVGPEHGGRRPVGSCPRRLAAADPRPVLLRPRDAGSGDSEPVCRAKGRQRGAFSRPSTSFPTSPPAPSPFASDVTLHLGPPVAVLLESDDSAGLAIPGLPNGTILIKEQDGRHPRAQMRGKERQMEGQARFSGGSPTERGPLCTPAFAMTDQKSQGKQFSNVLVNLKGVHSSGTVTRPSFMSLYVQLSRAQSWDGLHLFRKPGRGDFIEPKNVLDKDMREAILKLERRGEETRRRFEQDHRHESWFQEWAAMPESGQGTETDDVEDAALWRDPGVSELRS
ncbi:predicted protein [Chaetomium globosum CBS 148.51]|uniref:ATP-dependent DNA helicase n=1 Tax=Chaetomium globosum (strain ATCC 6205 / CBS 148.51 / DSM 1962 / NBRC 6347 / NRRL 1970) TaxID=306901 RepID=Q2GU16_CHAGB|nr:uncharacterized protein CHGG_08538 [Chaetomium globosum CBS 148.51]EAQ84524.1 predicted protein [Chaetomium globosum CBS 148.51]